MVSYGRKSDLDFVASMDAESAIRDLGRLVEKERKRAQSARETTAEAKKSQREMQKAYKTTADGAGKAAKKTRFVKDEMSGVGKIATSTLSNITSWIAGFASVATISAGIRGIVSSMKEAGDLRREMLVEAGDLEGLSMKLGHLRKDVSAAGLSAVQGDIRSVALGSHVGLDMATSALFYSESAMGAGTDRAKSAASSITDFAGAAGLTTEEVKMIPKLFSTLKADTKKKQMEVLNQLVVATGGSIAETGEYLTPFISTAVSDVERGYTYDQSLARMTAMIETTGSVAEAAEQSKRLADITAGRNEKGLEFMTAEAKTRGMDFSRMTDPQRLEFGRTLYNDFTSSGRTDELKTKLDVRGFSAMRAGFSEVATSKYNAMLPEIETGKESSYVQDMAEEFADTLTAKRTDRATRKTLAAAEVGRTKEASAVLDETVDEIFRLANANKDGSGDHFDAAMQLDGSEKHRIADMYISQNLGLAKKYLLPKRGSDEWNALSWHKRNKYDLLSRGMAGISSYKNNPDFVRAAYDATEGFSLINKYGELPYDGGTERYRKGLAGYEGIDLDKGGSEHTAAVKANTEAMKEHTEALNRRQLETSDPDGGVF